MEPREEVLVYIVIGACITGFGYWGSQDYHVQAVPILAGLGCGMLLYDLFDDMRTSKKDIRAWVYIVGQGVGAFICWGADRVFGGAAGLLVAVTLNYMIDALVGGNNLPRIIATAFDNVALAYLLGARSERDGLSKGLYVYTPGAIYVGLCLMVMRLKTGLEGNLKLFSEGATVGVILYTAVIELAPHMVENTTPPPTPPSQSAPLPSSEPLEAWVSAVSLFTMLVVAPAMHIAVSSWEKRRKERKEHTGSGIDEGLSLTSASASGPLR